MRKMSKNELSKAVDALEKDILQPGPSRCLVLSYYTYGCPVHWHGHDHADRRCSCRFCGTDDGKASVIARRRLTETDAEWAERFDSLDRLYTAGE